MRLLDRSLKLVGSKGVYLLVYTCTFTAYGVGLILGYHPTFSHALNLPVSSFGYLFIAVGLFCGIGAFARWKRIPFAVCVTLTTFWIFLLFTFWSTHRGFAWVAIMPWVTIALSQLLSTIRPEIRSETLLMPKALDDTNPALRANDYVDKVKKRTLDSANARERGLNK